MLKMAKSDRDDQIGCRRLPPGSPTITGRMMLEKPVTKGVQWWTLAAC
jgi:hypothetical protein